jgi:hypothetical protein
MIATAEKVPAEAVPCNANSTGFAAALFSHDGTIVPVKKPTLEGLQSAVLP